MLLNIYTSDFYDTIEKDNTTIKIPKTIITETDDLIRSRYTKIKDFLLDINKSTIKDDTYYILEIKFSGNNYGVISRTRYVSVFEFNIAIVGNDAMQIVGDIAIDVSSGDILSYKKSDYVDYYNRCITVASTSPQQMFPNTPINPEFKPGYYATESNTSSSVPNNGNIDQIINSFQKAAISQASHQTMINN